MPAPFKLTEQLVRVLDVLLDDPTGDHYGFSVAKAADIKTGTLYPIMTRLEDAGWLTSRWQDDDNTRGPRKRLYKLTLEGLTHANPIVAERAKTPHQRSRRYPHPTPGLGGALGAMP